MSFRLRKDAEKWFAQISKKPPFGIMWDVYYFCLMAGLASGRRSDPTADGRQAPEFVASFVDAYKPAQRLITALLIIAEARRLGVSITEKRDIQALVRELIDPQSHTGLSSEGHRAINAYASGGFDALAERRDQKPQSPEEFLQDFSILVKELVEEGEAWKET